MTRKISVHQIKLPPQVELALSLGVQIPGALGPKATSDIVHIAAVVDPPIPGPPWPPPLEQLHLNQVTSQNTYIGTDSTKFFMHRGLQLQEHPNSHLSASRPSKTSEGV